jgi:peptide/nickel transport system permease protein
MKRAQNKMRWALAFLAAVHVMALLAGPVAPYDPAAQNRETALAPPMRVHFFDAEGRFHARPFVYAWTAQLGGGYVEDTSRAFPLRFLVTGDEGRIGGLVTTRWHLFGVEAPGRIFLLGTDELGRDQFSRLVYGGQISLLAGVLAAVVALGLGAMLGSLAGFAGRWADTGIMRVAELFLCLPWLYLLFAVRAFLPLHITGTQAFLVVVVLIGLVGWARPARLIRGVVLSARERNYVLAARKFGGSTGYVLRRHVLPHTYGVLLTQAALLIPHFVLAEITLSFLGLGVTEPAASWGNMLGALQHYHVITSHWWMALPGLVLIPIFLAYQSLADALQERLRFIPL